LLNKYVAINTLQSIGYYSPLLKANYIPQEADNEQIWLRVPGNGIKSLPRGIMEALAAIASLSTENDRLFASNGAVLQRWLKPASVADRSKSLSRFNIHFV
jgi:hypothetical protein